MNLQEILSIPIEGKTICVIGIPASGKSFIAKQLYDKKHILVSTDTYMGYPFETQLELLMSDIDGKYIGQDLIIEGILSYRLLRRGAKEGTFRPDLIVECQISPSQQEKIYRTERPDKDLSAVKRMNIGLESIMNEYFFNTENRPEYLIWTNTHNQ